MMSSIKPTRPDERRSPLHDLHVEHGAKMVLFGGWTMPLNYSQGTLHEHMTCRRDAVVFDVSHLGTVRVQGGRAFNALQWAFTNDLNRIGVGRAQYTHLLDANDASVLDDIIIWWVGDDRFDVMPNASNTARVVTALAGAVGKAHVTDVTPGRALLAVQGPKARERLTKVASGAASIKRFHVANAEVAGAACVVAGTGYTGADGVEIAVPVQHAEAVWRLIADAGIEPAGLGARDTLRLEAGFPLHGHELGPGITSSQAGLGWVLCLNKGDFRGRSAVLAEAKNPVARELRGIVVAGRRPPRQGQRVMIGDDPVGVITSGNFSPVRGRGVALALLRPGLDVGTAVEIDVRGTTVKATIEDPPFHH